MTAATVVLNHFNSGHSDVHVNKQDKLFNTILIVLLVLYLIFGITVPYIKRIEIPREIKEQVPPQLTRILLKEKEIPVNKIEEKTPEPEKIELPKEPPKTKREVAKAKAKSSGLAAMKDELLSLRDAFVVKPKAGDLIKQQKNEPEKIKRKLLAAKADQQSQSISAAQAIKTVSSDELSDHQTQTVRLSEEEVLSNSEGNGDNELVNNDSNVRSEMRLRQTLEANKARLYALYNRALRKNPFLKGKVLFDIEIQPSGQVSNVTIQSSELADAKLERRLMIVLKSIDFGEEDVSVMNTIWAIEFLPR